MISTKVLCMQNKYSQYFLQSNIEHTEIYNIALNIIDNNRNNAVYNYIFNIIKTLCLLTYLLCLRVILSMLQVIMKCKNEITCKIIISLNSTIIVDNSMMM